jgi:hypothetical protein
MCACTADSTSVVFEVLLLVRLCEKVQLNVQGVRLGGVLRGVPVFYSWEECWNVLLVAYIQPCWFNCGNTVTNIRQVTRSVHVHCITQCISSLMDQDDR